MQSTMLFYITNEIKVRLKTSMLLWCYYGSIFCISIPNLLATILFNEFELYQTLPSIFLFLLLLFFPLNLDIIARESHLNMLDYLIMSSARFKTIYAARIIANALLMIIPITIGFLSIFFGQFFVTDFLDIFIFAPLLLGYMLIILLFFLFWFLIAMIIQVIIELKYPDSSFRVILYYCGLITMIGSLFLLNRLLKTSFIIIGVFFEYKLFENIFLSFNEIIIGCIIAQLLLSLIINKRIKLIMKKMLRRDQEMQTGKVLPKFGLYTLLEAERSIKSSLWRRMGPYFNAVPYLLIFIVLLDKSSLMENFMLVLGIHFFFILLYVLLIVFPRIIIEKEFNMEELLLSRITIYQYFFDKILLLFRSIFFPFIIATIMITILSWPSLFHPNSIYVFTILIIRAFYFVSVIIFVWRLFPSKNLLQTSLFSIIGLEILGFLVIRFICPDDYTNQFAYSPIIGSISIPSIMLHPNIENCTYSIFFSIYSNLILSIALFLGSLVLIKSEVRFE
ncbi:MAG: hypothetical protein ACFFB5_15420 [Promethearchaeota archaeon]